VYSLQVSMPYQWNQWNEALLIDDVNYTIISKYNPIFWNKINKIKY